MWIHVPTPGDHYSPAYGSACITVAYEISRQRLLRGLKSLIVVGKDTRHDYQIGDCVEVNFGSNVTRQQKIIDILGGRCGLPRKHGRRLYAPALEAIPRDFDGPVFIHNDPVAVSLFAQERPKAKICLWAANELFRRYTRRETEEVIKHSYRIICVSNYIANNLRAKLSHDDLKIKVVGNGVNLEQFQPVANKRQTSCPTVLYVGRVVRSKGVDLLVKAAQILAQKKMRFKVKIVGSSQFDAKDPLSHYEKELRDLAAPLGDKVQFVPAVDRYSVVQEYQQASIFCSPIRWNEPFGLTYLEAMATELPVITAPLGGASMACGDAALYFEPENVESLAQQLEILLVDSELRYETGIKSRQHAESCSWSHRYSQLLTALD
jgi:glycosyltransferase involved in cell wall biosynthesis